MNKKSREEDKIIMKHIFEVRLKKRLFSFMDFRGRMVEFMTETLNTNQIKLINNGSRFDTADDKLEKLYFFSIENFGFQSELDTSFDQFISGVKNLLSAIKKFPEYTISDGLVRIGTKSVILYHRKYDNTQSIKDAYKATLVNNHQKLSELSKSEIIDTAYTFDLKLENSKANVQTGPVTKEEALGKFFDGKIKEQYNTKFTKDNGMLFSIDVAGNNPIDIKDFDELQKQAEKQIKDIETVFNGFKNLFGEINQ